MTGENTKRILIIDDSEAIHRDFRRVLCPERAGPGATSPRWRRRSGGRSPREPSAEPEFEVDSAFQGQEGLAKVSRLSRRAVPMRWSSWTTGCRPAGMASRRCGTCAQVAPSLPVVLCSAYSDYSWEEIRLEFGESPVAGGAEEALRQPGAAPAGAGPLRGTRRQRLHVTGRGG